jgi:dihydroneopterin aldolase
MDYPAFLQKQATYSRHRARIQSELASRHFSLLEALAEHIAQILLNEFKAPWAKISVAKLQAIRGSKMVGICIERGQAN